MPQNVPERNLRPSKIAAGFWRFFSSINLALILIFIIVVLGIVGIFLEQAPRGMPYGSVGYQIWLEEVIRPDFGIWTDILGYFGLFDVFHSPVFFAAGALLVLNIFCCSLNRLKSILRAFRGGVSTTSKAYFQNSPIVLRIPSSTDPALSFTGILLKHRYRVRTQKHEGLEFIAADRYAFSRLGTVLSHLSLILLVIGFMLGTFFGFRYDTFVVAEGNVRSVGYDTGLSLGLVAFTADYWPDGTPREYRSDVVVYEDGQPVKDASILINHPLSYHGVRFNLSFFGPAAGMQVRTAEGAEVTSETVALAGIMSTEPYRRPLGRMDLPGTGLTAYLVVPATDMHDSMLHGEQIGVRIYEGGVPASTDWLILEPGETGEIEGLEFTYVESASFSGFIVKHDPGIWLVWVAFGLFLVGISMVLYLPYRRIQAMLQPEGTGRSIYLRATGRRGFDIDAELGQLAGEVTRTIGGELEKMNKEEKADG